MRYSQEYKTNCIELYRQGKWSEAADLDNVKGCFRHCNAFLAMI